MLKSGIHARSHIIPGENSAELEALTAAFHLQFQPADPSQLALVDTLIAAEWTQRRLRRIEAELSSIPFSASSGASMLPTACTCTPSKSS